MKRFFLRLFSATLAALIVLGCAPATRAQQSGGEKRRTGPIAGPVIKLPPGQYEVTTEAGEAEQQPAARRPGTQKWEYCVINAVGIEKKDYASNYTGVAHIRYFRGGRESVEGANEEEAFANALTKLGDEGWELVAIGEPVSISDGTGGSTSRYFFKRPR